MMNMNNVIPLNQPPADALGLMASLCNSKQQRARREAKRRQKHTAEALTRWTIRAACFAAGVLLGVIL